MQNRNDLFRASFPTNTVNRPGTRAWILFKCIQLLMKFWAIFHVLLGSRLPQQRSFPKGDHTRTHNFLERIPWVQGCWARGESSGALAGAVAASIGMQSHGLGLGASLELLLEYFEAKQPREPECGIHIKNIHKRI